MGRYSWSSRYTAEDCWMISISRLKEGGCFKGVSGKQFKDNYNDYVMKWSNSSGEEVANIGVRAIINTHISKLFLHYTWTKKATGEEEQLDYPVPVVSTACNYGGRRWWFICPLTINGVYCGKRVGRLYLPPNGKYFGCRHCYNLTYESCRENHKFDSVAYRMGITPQMLNGLFKRNKILP